MEPLDLFRAPGWLLLLVLPLALLFFVWRRSGGAVVVPFDRAEVRPARRWRVALGLAESLPALVLAVAIVLLAGPQAWEKPRSKRVLTNIEFCVDVSGSMSAGFGAGTRYDASMIAINRFVDARAGDAFGLTFFGNNVLHWVPLTTDVSAIKCAPPFMNPDQLPPWFGGTEIGKALLACRKVLIEREEGDRMIVLVTDGVSSDLSSGSDEEIARRLAADGITVYSIHIAEGGIPDPIVRITAMTGGEAFAPENQAALDHVFARIDTMRKTKLEKTHSESADDFRLPCLVGLSVLALALVALFGIRTTPW